MNLNIDISDFDKQINEGQERIKNTVRAKLQRIGEIYVATSREKGSYTDQTGNLRSANGYGIVEDGVLTEVVTGRTETIEGIRQETVKADMELIVGDGMNYASSVEARGKDVSSSGFLAAEKEARKLFK